MLPAAPPFPVCKPLPGITTQARAHQVEVEEDAFSQAHKSLTAQLSAGQEHVDQVSGTGRV